MKILIDMNLSPDWEIILQEAGWEASHWSRVGNPRASDDEILAWAHSHGYVVFTHDLDFGAILAATQTRSPSVFQLRRQDIVPNSLKDFVVKMFQRFQADLEKGALVSVDEFKARVRILPLHS